MEPLWRIVKGQTPPNKVCTGRLGLCAFFGLVLNDGSFPFRELVLPSRTPKGHTPANSSRGGPQAVGRYSPYDMKGDYHDHHE
jgi:hypothetical protein